MKLSEHFTLDEFVASQTAGRLGLDNTPDVIAIERMIMLCQSILEPARAALGPIRISSGYRAAAVNRAVGGSKESDHMTGDAADCIPLAVPKIVLARWIVEHVPFDQVILEYGTLEEPAWVHVSHAPGLRGQTLRILAGTGYEPVRLGA